METVVQIAAVCLAAAILGAVLRQHSPETAAVLGLAVCAVVGVLLLRGLAEVLDMLEELAAAGADLDLSGHTHNGQLFPGNVLIRLFWENPAGILQVGNMTSCVTQGAGVWGPAMRVGTDSEVMLLRVKFEG